MCFENVAFPLRENTNLPETLIKKLVLMKLEQVGLRGTQDLMPSELSGGMSRRVALARATAMDPELLLCDEPFTGLDPISLGVITKLVRELTDALNTTSIVVTHDVEEGLSIADHVFLLGDGLLLASGTPKENFYRARNPRYGNFCTDCPTALCRFTTQPTTIEVSFLASHNPLDWVRSIGATTIQAVERLGKATIFLCRTVAQFPVIATRPSLVVRQLHSVGVLTVLITVVAGAFVGMVLVFRGITL